MRERILYSMVCVLALVAGSASLPGEEARILATEDGSLLVRISQDGVLLEMARGEPVSLALPKAVAVRDVASLGSHRWALAGVRSTGRGQDLYLAIGSVDSLSAIKPPRKSSLAHRQGPILLAAEESLIGIAWLEGAEATGMEVRAVLGPEHSRVAETVAGRAPGSQTGLTGTVLHDGTPLLCWSLFDGTDDDVVCSRRLNEKWQKPRRVASNNKVPDITPSVLTVGRGALLTWSRYDGREYRLALARLGGDTWTEMNWQGPRGSLFPTFSIPHDQVVLTYRNAAAENWVVLALDEGGQILKSVEVPGNLNQRPIPVDRIGNELTLLWPDGDATTASWNALP